MQQGDGSSHTDEGGDGGKGMRKKLGNLFATLSVQSLDLSMK